MSDWHASVYGSRTGGSGGFGINPRDYNESWTYDDGFGDDGGVTFGANQDFSPRKRRQRHVVPERVLQQSAAGGYFRAREVISSGRMGDMQVASTPDGNTRLECRVRGASYDMEDYDVEATIDEAKGSIVSSGCNCPAYGRYNHICKHVVALITVYDENPELFKPTDAFVRSPKRRRRYTSKNLRKLMSLQTARLQDQAKSRQLNLLKEVNSRSAGNKTPAGKQELLLPAGSVGIRPQLERDEGGNWLFRAHITVTERHVSYVVKNLRALCEAVETQDFASYGQKLAFIHTPETFDERSRQLISIIARAVRIRDSVSGGYMPMRQARSESGEMRLSEDEVADILDLYVQADATFDYVPQGMSFVSSIPLSVYDGDPDLRLSIQSADEAKQDDLAPGFAGGAVPHGPTSEDASRDGYVIKHDITVDYFVVGRTSSFVFVHEKGGTEPVRQYPQAGSKILVYRCSSSLSERKDLLSVLCGPDEGEGLYLESDDVSEFCETVLPVLQVDDPQESDGSGSPVGSSHDDSLQVSGVADGSRHGLSVRMPVELLKMRRVPCQIETFLDRDDGGITCDIQAKYGETRFHVFLGIGPNEPLCRDKDAERLAVEAARHYFPAPDGIFARIPESDDDAIYRLLKEGLPVLRSIGSVYCTPSFDGLTLTKRPVLRVGLNVKSDLITISPIADEIDPSEVPALLRSYHKRRRFHRLSDGTFVDISQVDVSKLDEIGADLGVKPEDLAGGEVSVPAYAAYYLDSQADEADESDEFKSYLAGMKEVDPHAYEVPASLSSTLRAYQEEGFRWLNAACDKGFGGILADEMGLGKTIQMLAFLLSRKDEARMCGPSLIVCPASLVYNWEAECAKFAPELSVAVMAGPKAERRRVLRSVAETEGNCDGDAALDGGKGVRAADCDRKTSVLSHAQAPDLLITSYDLLRRDLADYRKCRFYCEVLDEAQYIKNHATKSAQAVRAVDVAHRFALTGTPIENRLSELWSIFDFLMPGMLGSYKRFRERFEMPILSGDDLVRRKLQVFVGPFILRRLKSQVLKDLPDKIDNVITVRLEGEQRKLYAALEQQLRSAVNRQDDVEFNTGKILILAQITRLRQACCDPRLLFDNVGSNVVDKQVRAWGAPARTVDDAAGEALEAEKRSDASISEALSHPRTVSSAKLDAIEELVSNCQDAGKKMLIFSQFTSFLDLIAERLRKNAVAYYTITGATAKKRRIELVDKFNGDETPVFLISLKAGNTGLNLTGASVVVHADPWWNAAAQNQATDRAHRIGQTKNVNVYQIVAKDTIEERILNLQNAKSDLARMFVDSAGTQSSSGMAGLSKDDLLALLG